VEFEDGLVKSDRDFMDFGENFVGLKMDFWDARMNIMDL